MSQTATEATDQPRYWPLGQLVLARVREFYREPEAVFWVYGFPVLMVLALGIAFRNRPIETVQVAIVSAPAAAQTARELGESGKTEAGARFETSVLDETTARRQLRTGKVALVVLISESDAAASSGPAYQYLFDPGRPESLVARAAVDDALQRIAGRKDVAIVENKEFAEPGGRYIDFLVPGLLGMSLMGGGLWGVGFLIVDMRIRKLLKRFLATPLKKRQFLAGMMLSRLAFLVPEVLVLLVFSRLAFGVKVYGNWLAVTALILLGAAAFAGLGLLVASRAKTIEAVSGLMNLVMLPMWVFSGVFFSSERFPAALQPFIQALPLTVLINALRAVMLDGASLASQSLAVLVLVGWALCTFTLALKLFRWN
jgi:ABC-type multidrug transport system permease subunit